MLLLLRISSCCTIITAVAVGVVVGGVVVGVVVGVGVGVGVGVVLCCCHDRCNSTRRLWKHILPQRQIESERERQSRSESESLCVSVSESERELKVGVVGYYEGFVRVRWRLPVFVCVKVKDEQTF